MSTPPQSPLNSLSEGALEVLVKNMHKGGKDFTLKDVKNLLDKIFGWSKEWSTHEMTSMAGFMAKELGKDHEYLNKIFSSSVEEKEKVSMWDESVKLATEFVEHHCDGVPLTKEAVKKHLVAHYPASEGNEAHLTNFFWMLAAHRRISDADTTRMYRKVAAPVRSHEPSRAACPSCTYLNRSNAIRCEMCMGKMRLK